MERWLSQISRQENLNRLEEETAAYYDALTAAERQDDGAWASAVSVEGAEAADRRTAALSGGGRR